MTDVAPNPGPLSAAPALSDWERRLADVLETMREMSLQTDPQAMVAAYAARMRTQIRTDRTLAISRRGLERPQYRITRDSTWKEMINPWKETHRLPLLQGGILGELIYGNVPRIFDGAEVPESDPAYETFRGYRTVVAIPHFDLGEGLNMVLLLWNAPGAFSEERLPDTVQISNLFGRATSNLVLTTRLEEAYRAIDRELEVVAEIQRSLLPRSLPQIPGATLAASYQTSKRAGGDYYDVFALPGGRWGILIADVSGHGTPAAVVMAITHAISHSFPGPPTPPGALLSYVNRALASRYTTDSGNFVTAFYAVYEPETRELTFSSAGHNPPRLRRADGTVCSLNGALSLPLGIVAEEEYSQHTERLAPGDAVLFYTDGITEAWSEGGDMFTVDRLDELVGRFKPTGSVVTPAERLVGLVLEELGVFTGNEPPGDDRTLLALCVEKGEGGVGAAG